MTISDNEALAHARLFQSSSPDAHRRLAAMRLRSRSISAGQVIFSAGDPAADIFLISAAKTGSGPAPRPLVQIRVTEAGSGQAVRFARIVEGDIFGEAEFIIGGLDPRRGTRITSARALTPLRLIPVPWADLGELLQIDTGLRTRFLKLGVRRFLDALWAQHSQRREDPDILLAEWLVEYAADLGVGTANQVNFPRKLSQTEIADELGVSRETISRRLKEWERAELVGNSGGQLAILDYSRVLRIAGLHSSRDRNTLSAAVADVADAIDRGDLGQARNIGADMIRYFPRSPELLHLLALCAARSGDFGEALAVLKGAHLTSDGGLPALRDRVAHALQNPFAPVHRVDAEGDSDPSDAEDEHTVSPKDVERLATDIAALEARVLKDRAFEASDPAERLDLAERSFAAYRSIWTAGGNWYAGVNAAAMALSKGDADEARAIARKVSERLARHPGEYWALASLGEALLICGDREGGLAALKRASEAADATSASRASTALQLRRLSSHLGVPLAQIRTCLAVRPVAVFTGHLFRGGEMNAEEQAEAARVIREQTASILKKRNIGHLHGGLACGADIVMAETALELGVQFHAVVPFPLPRYIDLSVNIGDPDGAPGHWRKRFDDVLAGAASLTVSDDEIPTDRDLDGHFFHGFRFMAGLASLQAARLEAECSLLAVVDDADPVNIAGSNQAVADWVAAGKDLDRIAFPFARKAPRPRPRGASSFRPCVFLWDTRGASANLDALGAAALGGDSALQSVPRTSRLGHQGTCLVAETLRQAIRVAEAVLANQDGGLRVICDFGPALGADLQADPRLVARMKAGSDLPGFPTGQPLATLNFAAQAVHELGTGVKVWGIGRSDETGALDRTGEVRPRLRSGSPVFRVRLQDEAGRFG